MKIISINLENTKIGIALFNGILLKNYKVIFLKEYLLEKHLVEISNHIKTLIKDTKCDLLVMPMLDLSKNNKELLSIESQVRGVVKYTCEKHKVIYQEYKVDGYFKKITSGKNTMSKKIRLLKSNDIYISVDKDDELLDDTIVVDAILLGEGVATGKLQISEWTYDT